MIKLPGLIDPHVHLRDPGQTRKEDFYTGTCAALAGGFTSVIDMPNNAVQITTEKLLLEKQGIASQKIVCDVGFYLGSLGDNLDEFEKVKDKVPGLKLYLNETTGNYTIDDKKFEKTCQAWAKVSNGKPILVHAEESILETILNIAKQMNQRIHVCHVSSKKELQTVLNAKEKGWKVACGVTPHHLFLTENNLSTLGPLGNVKPSLKPPSDVLFLWQHFSDIDIIESDHAPHTLQEKQSAHPPYGVPGLETTLPLLLTAAHQGKITIEDITRLCYENPAKIFSIPISHPSLPSTSSNPSTHVVVDENEEWTITNENLFTKCKWSPFNGWRVKGKVKRVFLRGTKVFEDGKILAEPGQGKILK